MPAMVMPSMSTRGSPSMIMRSAKVPESPSSALQTMYFCCGRVWATVRHLMPVGKPRRRGRASLNSPPPRRSPQGRRQIALSSPL